MLNLRNLRNFEDFRPASRAPAPAPGPEPRACRPPGRNFGDYLILTGPGISRILEISKIPKNPCGVLDLYNLRNFAEFPGRPGPGPGRGSSSAAPRIWNLKEFKIWPPGPGPGPPAIYN